MNTSNQSLLDEYKTKLEEANELFDRNSTDTRAIKAYEKCIEIARKIGDPKYLGLPLYNLAVASFDSYNSSDDPKYLSKAKKYLTETLQIAEKLNNPSGKALSLVHLGRVAYMQDNDWQLLYKNSVEAASIARKTEDQEILDLAESMINLLRDEYPQEIQQLEREMIHEDPLQEDFIKATLVVTGKNEKTMSFQEKLESGEITRMGIFDTYFPQPDPTCNIEYLPDEGESIVAHWYKCEFAEEIPMDNLSRLSEIFPELTVGLEILIDPADHIAGSIAWKNGKVCKDTTFNPAEEKDLPETSNTSAEISDEEFLSSITRKDESVEIKYNQILGHAASFFNVGNPQKAKDILEEVMDEYQSKGSKRDLNIARIMLATAHRLILDEYYPDYNRDPDTDQELQAVMHGLDQAEEYFSQKKDIDLLLNVYTEQAGLYIATNQLDQALEILTNKNDIVLRTARFHNLQFGLGQMGEILEKQKKPDEALKAYKRQVLVAKRHNDKDGLAGALYNIGWLYKQENDPKNARKYLSEALPICKAEGLIAMQLNIESIIKDLDQQKAVTPPKPPENNNRTIPKPSAQKAVTPQPLVNKNAEAPSNDLIPEQWGVPLIIILGIIMLGSAVLFFVFNSIFLKIICLIIFGLLLWLFISSKVISIERKK